MADAVERDLRQRGLTRAMQTDVQRLARFFGFSDVPDYDVDRLAATLDHVVAQLRDPAFARLRHQALERWPLREGD